MSTSTLYLPIMNALLARLQAKCGRTFLTYGLRFKTWEMLTTDQQSQSVKQPALYLLDGVGLGGGRTRYEQRGRGLPVKRFMHVTIVVYAQLPGAGNPIGIDVLTPGIAVFYPLIESIEAAFTPDVGDLPGGTITLVSEGFTSHAWLSGDRINIPPDIDPGGQGMFTMPVEILIP